MIFVGYDKDFYAQQNLLIWAITSYWGYKYVYI